MAEAERVDVRPEDAAVGRSTAKQSFGQVILRREAPAVGGTYLG
jgi:hypothetical protein